MRRVNFVDDNGKVVGYIERDDEDNVTGDRYGRQMLVSASRNAEDDCAAFELFETGWTRSSLIHPQPA